MGNTGSKEAEESWEREDVKRWMESCRKQQKQWYNGYAGTQFHTIDCSEEGNLQLLTAKVCFPLFGLPTDSNANTLLDGYTPEQQKVAATIVDKICEMYPLKKQATVEIMTLFVYCKSGEQELCIPVFRLRIDDKTIKYLDMSKRDYCSWQDFLDSNKLPMMLYCYPKHGFYTCCEDGEVSYVEDKFPALIFGLTAASNLSSRIASGMDTTSMVTSFGSAGILIAGMFTPVAPALLVAGGVAGAGSAFWGTARSAQRLYDKRQHGECLTDLEAMMAWGSIALTPLSIGASAVNASVANGARATGRIFTPTMRTAVTMLNFATFGMQGGMLVLGIANLVQKKQNDQLSTLDVLQFSMTLFFFTNTAMQPKTANGIIARAQAEHIQQTRSAMSDEAAIATFEKYLAQNKGDGGISDTAAIVKSLNKINNPDQLFGGLADMDTIRIGGRKGNTLLVNKEGMEAMPTRIKANGKTLVTPRSMRQFSAVQRRQMEKALSGYENTPFGRDVLDPAKMKPHEAAMLDKTLRDTCGNYDRQIVDAAVSLAQDLDVQNVGDFRAVLEIVSQSAGPRATLASRLAYVLGEGRTEFLESLRADTARAREIAVNAGKAYDSVLRAVYHYRKHGAEFMAEGDPMDYYLRVLPEKYFTTENLRNVETRRDVVIETYCSPGGEFGVLMKRHGTTTPIVATVFRNDRYMEQHNAELAASIQNNNFRPPTSTFLIIPVLLSICIDEDEIQAELKREREMDHATHGCRSCSKILISAVDNCPEKGFECVESWPLTTNVLFTDECRCNEIKCADPTTKLSVKGEFVDKVRCKDKQWTLRSNSSIIAASAVCAKGCDVGVCQPSLPNAPVEYFPLDVKAANVEDKCASAVCPNGFVSLNKDGSVDRTFESTSVKCSSDGYWRSDDGVNNQYVMCEKEKQCAQNLKDGIEMCNKLGLGPCVKMEIIAGKLECPDKYVLYIGNTKTGDQQLGIGGSCVKGEWILEMYDQTKKPLNEIGDVVACLHTK